ncbi:MAG: 2-amino-4-hydroxy-6-hydroxymethyldihydropteridine diphosphokinase [Sciscionella sp.]|nr:2-amino-4-hydroxy-6-hydroxymethyldihydropteridine diphosphokinase [Sciscionella sp.]
MTTAVLSIGSNLGDRLANLRLAVDGLGGVDGDGIELLAVSSVYATAPWGVVDQDDFYNAVLIARADRSPRQWLELALLLEKRAGRVRERRWGPRTLDVDVITVDDVECADDRELILPHPRAHQRAFVLLPWLEIEPDAVLPGRGPIAELAAALPADELAGVRRMRRLELTP